jgi:hypothetical protein
MARIGASILTDAALPAAQDRKARVLIAGDAAQVQSRLETRAGEIKGVSPRETTAERLGDGRTRAGVSPRRCPAQKPLAEASAAWLQME